MDGSFGSGRDNDGPPDTPDNGKGRIETENPIGDFKETLRPVPGTVVIIPKFTADLETGRPKTPEKKVQAYEFLRDVNELDVIVQLLGGDEEASMSTLTSIQVMYLRELWAEGKKGPLATDDRKNSVLVRFTEDELIDVISVYGEGDSKSSKVRLSGTAYRFEEGSWIVLCRVSDIECSSPAP